MTDTKKLRNSATTLSSAAIAAVWLYASDVSAAELCRFTGTTDYQGRATITTDVARFDGLTRVDVVGTFAARWNLVLPVQYLMEEISTWKGNDLQEVAVNYRYLVADHIVRQNWDVFQRGPDGLQGRRVQGKTFTEFRERHPGFAQHWDASSFARTWLQDYVSAAPERRADLDLKGTELPPGLRSPLAMAFYWVRFLPRRNADVPVFLPGFKADRILELPIQAGPDAAGMRWMATLRHPALSVAPVSTATAWITTDNHLQRLAFDLHGPGGSAQGQIHQEGCKESPGVVTERQR